MRVLPEPLIAMIRERIANPARRNIAGQQARHGSSYDPQEIQKFLTDGLQDDGTGARDPFAEILRQMEEWGQQMPEMHMTSDAFGSRSASSERGDYPLAPPASDADLARLEQRVGRPLPRDLRQMFQIADGGWGPGVAYTVNRGPGIMSIERLLQELEDLQRRGPGYTGEAEWPANLLPLTDFGGTISYDLETGHIVHFNDFWYDHDQTIEQAFSVKHPSLQDYLQEWVLD